MPSPSPPTICAAQVIDSFGGPDQLHNEVLSILAPGAGQIQVKLAAAAVNPVDLQTRVGYVISVEAATFPMVLGWDAAGVVERVGDEVEGWQVGERAAAMSFQPIDQNGTYAEYVNLAADLVARVPAALELERAATLPLAGLTASQLLDEVNLPASGSLLVDAPVGAVGRLVVQLAARAGINVIAVVKAQDRDRALELGATEVVDRGHFAVAVREMHPGGVDGAVDLVGRATGRAALASVRDGGAYVTSFNDYDDPTNRVEAERDIRVAVLTVRPDTATLTSLLEAASRGELTTAIERTYPLAEAAEAHRRLEQGGLRGKLVLLA